MPTLHALKPRFQGLLRPMVRRLAATGVTANQVTVTAAALSVATGAVLCAFPHVRGLFWLLPVVLLLRMALNAIDGMLAREHGQITPLGLYLNELADLVSDLALALPFAFLPGFGAAGVAAFAALALIAEHAGVLGYANGAGRVYAGPFGKSDRAVALGLLGAIFATGVPLAPVAPFVFPAMALLAAFTVVNRARAGLSSIRP